MVNLSKENKVWIVPTQALFDRWFSPISAETLDEQPEMQYMSPDTRENWLKSKINLTGGENFDAEKWKRYNQLRYQLIKAHHEKGQGLLLGSDAPQVYNVPGFSIHHELKGMLDAGLSPLEAIQIGTLNPATFFDENFGQVKAGLDADLILVEENPLDNIENLKNPAGVMARGQWLNKSQIEEKLEAIAENYKKI
ncbi:MAG: amidohydrolase family protein [Cyclobacteriaceae bacterium]